MPASETNLLSVRLPDAERRRIKIMAASQGVTIRQAIHEAFDAWALQLQSRAPAPDAARGAPAGAHSEKPRQPPPRETQPRPAFGRGKTLLDNHRRSGAHRRGAFDKLAPPGRPVGLVQCAAAQSVRGERGNVWVVRGTRVPLAAIFKRVAEGYPFVEIQELFGLTLQQLMAILQFAAEGAAPVAADR